MSFTIKKKSKQSLARQGVLDLPQGRIKTPFFMPIATAGAIKGLTTKDLSDLGAQILLSNTYHLWLRPSDEIVKSAGGLHDFMLWDKPILTDSGGFQVFSLSKMRELTPEGVKFRSHLNGELRFLSPQKAWQIQQNLNSDIAMVLDECAPYPCSREDASKALERTTSWAKKSRQVHLESQSPNKQFGIVQGSVYKDLRLRSAKELIELGFDGYAIGGLAVGEEVQKMYEVLDYLTPVLPADKPRYLMGVGYPEQIVKAVQSGVDMFDCVLPTRNARHGSLFVRCFDNDENAINLFGENFYKVVHIKNEQYKEDFEILDEKCGCPTCQAGYSKAYLRHLLVAKEPLYIRLATAHNIRFYLRLMADIRGAISNELL